MRELTWQQRDALQLLDTSSPIRGTDLQAKHIGSGTLLGLVESGLASHASGPRTLQGFYIITEAGREARQLPTKKTWPVADRRLKALPPRVRTVPSRFEK